MTASVRAARAPDAGRAPIPGIRNIVAVGAGKGGVGKTTVSVNLAVALARLGGRVGMIDGDIYGPNVPIMLGVKTRLGADGDKIAPASKYGIDVVSMGFLADDDTPVIWRGPMLHGIVQQFFREVRWPELDYLIVDMPPGTGDVALSLSQTVPVSGSGRGHDTADRVARGHAPCRAHVPQARDPDAGPGREHEPLRLS